MVPSSQTSMKAFCMILSTLIGLLLSPGNSASSWNIFFSPNCKKITVSRIIGRGEKYNDAYILKSLCHINGAFRSEPRQLHFHREWIAVEGPFHVFWESTEQVVRVVQHVADVDPQEVFSYTSESFVLHWEEKDHTEVFVLKKIHFARCPASSLPESLELPCREVAQSPRSTLRNGQRQIALGAS